MEPMASLPTCRPGIDDAIIARATARMLERYQYLHLPFDETVSSNLLVHYLDFCWIRKHMHFFQSRLGEDLFPITARPWAR